MRPIVNIHEIAAHEHVPAGSTRFGARVAEVGEVLAMTGLDEMFGGRRMIQTTTHSIEGHRITAYHGVVVGEAILGANVLRDLLAGIRDFVGGRSAAYEPAGGARHRDARAWRAGAGAGGNAVVGIDLDYEVVGQSMLMVSVSGTSVTVESV